MNRSYRYSLYNSVNSNHFSSQKTILNSHFLVKKRITQNLLNWRIYSQKVFFQNTNSKTKIRASFFCEIATELKCRNRQISAQERVRENLQLELLYFNYSKKENGETQKGPLFVIPESGAICLSLNS